VASSWEQRWWGIDTGRPIIVEIVKAIGLKPDEFMKTFNSTFPNYRYNMLRTAIIWKYGGFYVDTDVICLRSPEHLLDDAGVSYAMASEEKIEGAIFAARPKHPFNEHLFRILVERARIPTILQRAHGTGPEAFQHAIETYPEHMPKVKILEQRYIDVSQRMMDFRIETYPRRDQATIVHAHVGHWGYVVLFVLFGVMNDEPFEKWKSQCFLWRPAALSGIDWASDGFRSFRYLEAIYQAIRRFFRVADEMPSKACKAKPFAALKSSPFFTPRTCDH